MAMSQHPEDLIKGRRTRRSRSEFLESLRDGREVYIYGERVKDVTTHPALRNAAVSVAKLYDALHDANSKGVLTAATDTGSGGYTHKFFKAARSRQDVIAQRDAIAAWARITYGWMGRSPDYKAAFLNTLGANADFYGKFADNAAAWHKRGQEAVLYLNHALVNPPIDRAKPVEEVKDVYITIQKETGCRHLRLRRQGGGHQLGAHPLQFPRPEHGPGDQRPRHGRDVHRPHEHARASS
jgi:4-hydroxyphenylacetate 3-monooxygenase